MPCCRTVNIIRSVIIASIASRVIMAMRWLVVAMHARSAPVHCPRTASAIRVWQWAMVVVTCATHVSQATRVCTAKAASLATSETQMCSADSARNALVIQMALDMAPVIRWVQRQIFYSVQLGISLHLSVGFSTSLIREREFENDGVFSQRHFTRCLLS